MRGFLAHGIAVRISVALANLSEIIREYCCRRRSMKADEIMAIRIGPAIRRYFWPAAEARDDLGGRRGAAPTALPALLSLACLRVPAVPPGMLYHSKLLIQL